MVADTLRSTGYRRGPRGTRRTGGRHEGHSAVVLGSAIRMGKVIKEATDFVRRNHCLAARGTQGAVRLFLSRAKGPEAEQIREGDWVVTG